MAGNEETEFLGSWEEMADSGVLDKQIAHMQAVFVSGNPGNNVRNSDIKPVVIFQEEEGRTRYSTSEPAVTILKRPTKGSEVMNGADNNRMPKIPVKTLQQRELEYAEARLRILGEARSPEEESSLEEKTLKIHKVPKIDILRPQSNEPILRQPRGPDGTKGFTLPR